MFPRLPTHGLFFVLFASVAACESSASLGETTGTGTGSLQQPPSAATSQPPEGPAPAPVVLPDATLAEVKARCANPAHGPVDGYATFQELRMRLIGRWFACDVVNDPSVLYRREAGIEFRADGTWRLLRVASDGSFVDQRGLDNEGTWHEKYDGFVEYIQVNWSGSSTNGMVLTQFELEAAPTRLRVTDYLTKEKTWFVPIAVTGDSTQLW
jgi:hypothetical protein